MHTVNIQRGMWEGEGYWEPAKLKRVAMAERGGVHFYRLRPGQLSQPLPHCVRAFPRLMQQIGAAGVSQEEFHNL